MVDFRGSPAPYQLPPRKPVPPHASVNHSDLQPLTKIVPDPPSQHQQHQQQHHQPANVPYSQFPPRQASRHPPSPSPTSKQYSQFQNNAILSRRTPSQSTTSTQNTGVIPSRTPSNVSSHISRTSSTRSGASSSPGSYVALMRKQKATVWCDRAQHEDPRIVAQQKAAKIRAAREIHTGVSAEGRTSTSGSMGSGSLGVRAKIRHHGLPRATGYSANLVGGGVPMRLSANEVGDEGSHSRARNHDGHQRALSSGSTGNRYLNVDHGQQHRYSQGSMPSVSQGDSPGSPNIPELDETPVPGNYQSGGDYFAGKPGNGGSGSSSERESSFGKVGQMEGPPAPVKEKRTAEELRRRGSVDERTNTMGFMGSGRLFVANPDLSD